MEGSGFDPLPSRTTMPEEVVAPMEETVPAETASATSPEQTAPAVVEEIVASTPVAAASGDAVEDAQEQQVPMLEQETPDPSNVEEVPSQVPTERPFSFDFDYLQSLVCGAIDPFINGITTTTPKEAPPPPAGFWQAPIPKETDDDDNNNSSSCSRDDVPTLRNSDLQEGEDLVRYTTAGESVKTLFQSFEWGVKRNPRAPCLGKRKTATSPYTWKTYGQIQVEAEKIGIYLKSLGVTQGQRVGFSGKNAPEYLTAIQGCFWAGATTVRELGVRLCFYKHVYMCVFIEVRYGQRFRSILVSSFLYFVCTLVGAHL